MNVDSPPPKFTRTILLFFFADFIGLINAPTFIELFAACKFQNFVQKGHQYDIEVLNVD